MPLKLKSYARAKASLNEANRARLDSILDADPRMAKHLNEHGMVNAASSKHPIAVIPPDKYPQLARKQEPEISDFDNRKGLLARIMTQQPYGGMFDVQDSNMRPDFLHGYMKHHPRASSYEIYSHKGIGLPPGYDMHQGLSVHDFADDYALDLGGLPALKYTPRGKKGISITDHEGRGRNAYAMAKEFSLPTQMIERAAILPDDVYVPTNNVSDILWRLGTRNRARVENTEEALLHHNEPALLNEDGNPAPLNAARDFLRQIKGAVPEEFVRFGMNTAGEYGGSPLRIPWKFPVFAKGGSVQHFEHGGSKEPAPAYDSSKDDTGMLRTIGHYLRMASLGPQINPGAGMLMKALPRVAEGMASEYYGVNQNGRVNLGGYTKGAPLRDRFRPNVAIEPISTLGLFGNDAGQEAQVDVDRTDTAVREAFGNGDPANFGEDAAYLTGKALAIPVLSGGRGLQTLTQGALKNASKWLRYPVRALETATDLFNPASGRVREAPIAGVVGAGISEGLNTGMEKYYTHQLEKQEAQAEAEKEAVLNDPQFQQALAAGDKERAMMIAKNIMEQFNAR